ncbi:MAG: GspH/FimT family pseudopilin [Pseudomonadota bacterium]|nr:GspH/FimT family pseudopilin [Pseudomonadota bacterium]
MARTRMWRAGSDLTLARGGRARCAAGFTLIEIIIVLTLAGLLLALVPPRLSAALAAAEIRSAARELASALRYARSRAVTRHAEVLLTLDTERRRYRVSGSRWRALPEDLQVKLTTARSERRSRGVGSIRFYPDGTGTGGQIALGSGARRFIVDVSWLTGRIAIYTGSS